MKSYLLIFVLLLGGCASTDYALYAKTQGDVEIAKHNADAEKYKSMSAIAATGTDAAKVAAVMAMAMGNTNASQQTRIQAPSEGMALKWAQVLVPGLTQVAGMRYNYLGQLAQSDNAARVAESTNSTFLGIAGHIQTQAPSIVNNTTSMVDSHDSLLSGYGTLGSGAYTTTDDHAVEAPVTPIITPVVVSGLLP